MNDLLRVISNFSPAGDQPTAIKQLVQGINDQQKNQVLLGVTGSGKTFTMAHVIERTQKPTLIMAPNKTLAAQLYSEMKEFFPNNATEYFVSYYDYYQPEAYVPSRDIYIEKEATINQQIERLRHSATRSLMERRDVVIVASVSCIYGIGPVESYAKMKMGLEIGQKIELQKFTRELVKLLYKRNDLNFCRGNFRVRGDIIDIFPSHSEHHAWRLSLFGDEIESIWEFVALTGERIRKIDNVVLYANSHYITPDDIMAQAIQQIKSDLKLRLEELHSQQKIVEALRLEQRITFDLENLVTTGTCPGIENYSRYLSGRAPGEHPPTLLEYLPKDALLIVDESHVAIPQVRGMYLGDASRKQNLSEYGFRLPSCMDNRPLKFEEWDNLRPQSVFVSATPGPWELEVSNHKCVEQVVRPTGLLDPECFVRPTNNQIDDLINEIHQCIKQDLRVLVTTLTKKMAEDLTTYLQEAGIAVGYLHSEVHTLERIEIIRDLRAGEIKVLVGINLLREGIDIPECGLVAILDADKEGFLRSRTSLIQIIGRAARNEQGKVIMYADNITASMQAALEETNRRKEKQALYNQQHNITPLTVQKKINDFLPKDEEKDTMVKAKVGKTTTVVSLGTHVAEIEKKMRMHAENLEFEEAAKLRDYLRELKNRK